MGNIAQIWDFYFLDICAICRLTFYEECGIMEIPCATPLAQG
jgi:hypothetical protein